MRHNVLRVSVLIRSAQYITHAEAAMHMINKATVPGAFLCDCFPWSTSVQFDVSAFTLTCVSDSEAPPVMAAFPKIGTSREGHDPQTRYKAFRTRECRDGESHALPTIIVLSTILQAKGSAPPSLTRDLLSTESGNQNLHHHIKWSTGSLYGGQHYFRRSEREYIVH